MWGLFQKYRYTSENAIHLFHLFVNELESKIIDGYLNVGSVRFPINYNNYREGTNIFYKEVGYRCQHNAWRMARLHIELINFEGDIPYLLINNMHWSDGQFCFPFDSVIFEEQPLLCFNTYMKIAVSDMPCVQQIAEFNNFLETEKEARRLKKKTEFLRHSLNKSLPHSLLNSIVSDEYLKSELIKNGTKH
jgi:hypothetical protein